MCCRCVGNLGWLGKMYRIYDYGKKNHKRLEDYKKETK